MLSETLMGELREEFEEKIEALGQKEEEENKSETWISNLVKEYAKVNIAWEYLDFE